MSFYNYYKTQGSQLNFYMRKPSFFLIPLLPFLLLFHLLPLPSSSSSSFFWRVSHSLGWSWTYFVTVDDPELLSLLPQPPEDFIAGVPH